jgi:hypothetical protein
MKKLICLTIALVTMAALASVALAGTHAQSTIKLNGDKTKLKGTITSAKAKCEKTRVVDLYRRHGGGGFESFDEGVSDNHGHWVTDFGSKVPQGTYRVKVKKEGSCSAANSPELKVG